MQKKQKYFGQTGYYCRRNYSSMWKNNEKSLQRVGQKFYFHIFSFFFSFLNSIKPINKEFFDHMSDTQFDESINLVLENRNSFFWDHVEMHLPEKKEPNIEKADMQLILKFILSNYQDDPQVLLYGTYFIFMVSCESSKMT